ncbi:type I restriction-modification system, M subunit [Pseudomonas aeruginosa]|nr:type I restriction-modification system, M subunit [Pseudomonas aeruginosa]
MNTSTLVQKVWNFCHTLRDDGVGYGDYLEQLTYLLFLKLAHEYAQEPYNRDTHIPEGYDWTSLTAKVGEPLERHYFRTLNKLGKEDGMLGAIFFKAQNKIQDPAKLSRLVQLIDAESWISLGADTKGDLYEGLLQKNAEDTKSGAGQYFYTASNYPGHGCMYAAATDENHCRSCLWNGRLLPGRERMAFRYW